MAPQLLFYENAVPISTQDHRDVCVHGHPDYGFARGISAAPLTAAELPVAASEYAVVFVGQDDDVTPAVVLGVRDGENLYVGPDGRWTASYIPAFVRRYPFVFASGENRERLVLCIDEASPMVNRDGRGERLFDAEGKRTTYLENVLAFMQRYQTAFVRSQQFAKRLKALDLLQPVQAQLRGPAGELQLRGFMTVDRARLKALAPDVVQELLQSDALEAIYLHLTSLRHLKGLAGRALPASPNPTGDGAAEFDDLNQGDILIN